MTLKYRGVSYEVANTTQVQPQKVVEGKYHGIKIQISLPQMAQSLDEVLHRMVYRGIRLAAQ